jgi:hypothetical protein
MEPRQVQAGTAVPQKRLGREGVAESLPSGGQEQSLA